MDLHFIPKETVRIDMGVYVPAEFHAGEDAQFSFHRNVTTTLTKKGIAPLLQEVDVRPESKEVYLQYEIYAKSDNEYNVQREIDVLLQDIGYDTQFYGAAVVDDGKRE